MPNHITNRLIISGSGGLLDKFYKENKNKESSLSFDKAVPPEKGNAPGMSIMHSMWFVRNWGTKWNAYDVTFSKGKGKLTYNYLTAWSPPAAWLESVSKKYPSLKIINRWYDEDYWSCGELTLKDGIKKDLHYDSGKKKDKEPAEKFLAEHFPDWYKNFEEEDFTGANAFRFSYGKNKVEFKIDKNDEKFIRKMIKIALKNKKVAGLLKNAINDFGYQSSLIDDYREVGLIEGDKSLKVSGRVNTDHIFSMMFASGEKLMESHLKMILLFLGLLSFDSLTTNKPVIINYKKRIENEPDNVFRFRSIMSKYIDNKYKAPFLFNVIK